MAEEFQDSVKKLHNNNESMHQIGQHNIEKVYIELKELYNHLDKTHNQHLIHESEKDKLQEDKFTTMISSLYDSLTDAMHMLNQADELSQKTTMSHLKNVS